MTPKPRNILVLMHPWGAPIQEGIARYLTHQPGWHCTRIPPIPECVPYILREQFDGAITWLEQGYVSLIRSLNIPVIDVSNGIRDLPFPSILPDDKAIGRLGAEHLMELGLRRFVVVDRTDDPPYAVLRRDSFLETIRARGFVADVVPRPDADHPVQAQPASPLQAWLSTAVKPFGVFAVDDNMAVYVLDDCHLLGIKVPDEAAVLGAGNFNLAALFARPSLSSIAIPDAQIGFEAARLLDRLIDGEPPPAKPFLLPPVGVVARHSTNVLVIDDEDIRNAVRYIREHVHDITVRKLLRAVPMNRRYLERKFVNLIGRTPLQEIRHQRIARAKALLAETDLAMPAIARRSGFANSKRLANVFHAQTGQTPTQYRRTFRHYAD